MKAGDWLIQATKKLEKSGISTARLDCLVLLEDATGKDRAWLLAHLNNNFSPLLQGRTLQTLNEQIKKRAMHEPLAYIRGKTEFYGREFIVNKDVLEPRPESETMIELLKQSANTHQLVANSYVVDIGTGSGALAITAKLETPSVKVIATDIDHKCLQVAKKNANKYCVDIEFYKGNLLDPLSTKRYALYAILANLPYVPDSYQINQAAAMEPRKAIYGGVDGLDIYRQLFDQINWGNCRVQYLLTESLPFQHKALKSIAQKTGFKLVKTNDFIQLFTSLAHSV